MDAAAVANLEGIVSTERLQRYKDAGDSYEDTLFLYLWNIKLAEALLPALALFEITLRNAVHAHFTAVERTEYWFQNVLVPRKWANIEAIINEHTDYTANPPALPIAAKVISETTFSLWTHIFARGYNNIWWDPTNPPLAHILPNHPRIVASTRNEFHVYLLYFLNLRNRAMHHQAIFHGVGAINMALVDLPMLHRRLKETLRWINSDAARFLNCIDMFPTIWSDKGRQVIRARLKVEFNIP